jgi:secreted trypsin-like serine protease
MKKLFTVYVILLLALKTQALNTEIINGVEGDMNGTGPHMVYISLVQELANKNGTFSQLRRNCSGSLITKNTVMTAAHCFGMNAEEISKINLAYVYFTLDANKSTSIGYETRKFKVHSKFNTIENYLNNDIAVISFSGNLPKGYKAADYQKTDDTFLLGQEFRAAGYGQQFDHSNPLAYTAISIGKLMSTKLKFDSEYPSTKVFPTHMSAQQTSTGICNGDSGGAAFVRSPNMQFKIVGINSSTGTEKSCLDGKSYYTRVSLFADWIAQALKELN